jgi:AAA domain
MNSLPLGSIPFRWRDHLSALRRLGLLYRRPQQFRDDLSTCSVGQQLVTAFWLLVHSAPYVFALSAAGCLLGTSLIGSEFRIEHLAVGIAIGLVVGLAVWLALWIGDWKSGWSFGGLVVGLAAGLAVWIAGGVTGGITVGITGGFTGGFTGGLPGGITSGITSGMTGGLAAGLVVGIASRLAGGLTGAVTGGLAVGVGVGLVGGLVFGLAVGLPGGIGQGIAGGIGFGLAGGMTGGLASGLAFEIFSGIAVGIAGGIAFGIAVGIASGIAYGIAVGISSGIASGIAFGISSTRIYYQLVHPPFVWPRLHGCWYPRHPVAWDDLCSVPFPGLDHLLVDYAEKAPESGVAEIERLISSYPSQRMMALRSRVRLLARQAGKTVNLAILDEILAPLPEGEKGFLAQTGKLRAAVHEIATLQSRLDTFDRPVLREPYAKLLCKEIENFRGRISGFHEPLATEFRTAADQWLKIAEKQLLEIQPAVETAPVLQVFRAGDPVDREKEAFVPRDSVVGHLQEQVLLSTGCPGVVLYGRRRVGKSTVLRNLSWFLPPRAQTVNISMQNPEASTSLELLAQHLVREVSAVFGERLPSRTPKDLRDLFGFLSDCNQILERDDRRLVISVDEYENIDQKIGQGVFPEDLLATFRESIQSHRRITWIFAGGHEITELVNAPWTSYLVSARTIEVPLFSQQETRLLLTEPLKYSSLWRDDDPGHPRPRFESGFWGEGGIERIHAEAGGWPHLVQLIAETIVNLLNSEGGRRVSSPLMERALDRAIVSGHNVLYELLRRESRLPGEWEYISKFRIRETQPPPDDEAMAQSLRRRLLVEEESGQWRLRVPLMSRWLRKRG